MTSGLHYQFHKVRSDFLTLFDVLNLFPNQCLTEGVLAISLKDQWRVACPCLPHARLRYALYFTVLGDMDPQKHKVKLLCLTGIVEKAQENIGFQAETVLAGSGTSGLVQELP